MPIVGYDASEAGEGGVGSSWSAFAEAGAPDTGEAGARLPRKEWDAGVDDDAQPGPADEELTTRMRHLLESIAQGDPALAPDVLYPRDAWVRSRDTSDPGKAWDTKVKPAFLRDLQKLHRRNKGIDRAHFVSFELGHTVVNSPARARDLKKPVWRVRHSKLTYTLDQKIKRIDIAEMTAFRGAWYVTKLR